MLKPFQSKLRKKNILWLFAGLPEREIVQEGWMSASMGPDYYQVPDMFTVASIQVLMMYYFHCKNSIDGGHDEDEYWPRDPYIQWKQTHLFVPADPWYPQSYSSSAESLIKYTIVTIMHFCVIMFIQGIRSSLLFPWAAQHGRNWGFKICFSSLWTIKPSPYRLQLVVQSLVNTGYQLKEFQSYQYV